jgi:hypothetical protein
MIRIVIDRNICDGSNVYGTCLAVSTRTKLRECGAGHEGYDDKTRNGSQAGNPEISEMPLGAFETGPNE